jgi:hypothetical protein
MKSIPRAKPQSRKEKPFAKKAFASAFLCALSALPALSLRLGGFARVAVAFSTPCAAA